MLQQVPGAIPHNQLADGDQMTFQELLDQDTEGDGLLRDVVVPVIPGAGEEQRQKQQL